MKNKTHDISSYIMAVIIAIVAILSAFLLCYAFFFRGGITAEHTRWAEFGDYIAGIAGILNVIAFMGLTIVIHQAEKSQLEKSTRFHAEEFIIKKVQAQIEFLDDFYIPFQKAVIHTKDMEEAKSIANDTFESLQPFMTYLYYIQKLDFLPKSTIDLVNEFHNYLNIASDNLLCYALDIEDKKGQPVQPKDVLKAYREIYRFLEELDVRMTADVADFAISEKDSTNYREVYPNISKSLKERMASGDPNEMLKAQQEFLIKVSKSQEKALEKLDESQKKLLAQIEKMGQKQS